MLHQIRKMIGFVIMLIRLGLPSEIINVSMTDIRVRIPKAPALGLLLVEVRCHFKVGLFS